MRYVVLLIAADNTMGLLTDTYNCGLRMHMEYRERFPPPPTSKETVS